MKKYVYIEINKNKKSVIQQIEKSNLFILLTNKYLIKTNKIKYQLDFNMIQRIYKIDKILNKNTMQNIKKFFDSIQKDIKVLEFNEKDFVIFK